VGDCLDRLHGQVWRLAVLGLWEAMLMSEPVMADNGD
jgi:hypothetical protein